MAFKVDTEVANTLVAASDNAINYEKLKSYKVTVRALDGGYLSLMTSLSLSPSLRRQRAAIMG